ncbi:MULTISPECIES: alpha/beta hydrolase [unclassified Pseudomonas]|uniref:alpha/beta hydrolase n=1 Tax=unclassified Pseudomonas TaxID=196821 RepID=UPI000839903B|nr:MULTISPECIES: alpha/beta hydrolase [unclassified Pseudomonas]QIH07185.1 alpha/beta hydrolase [Pseudomonas sp. BIOMIG1BAC]
MSYQDQHQWKAIQAFLPKAYQIDANNAPLEEYWSWRGHDVHLDRFVNPTAPAKVILFHGVGTNGRQMSTIAGLPLARLGLETVAIDMPGYGETQVAPKAQVRYDTWVELAHALIEHEHRRDSRPIFLYGLSAGGMLTYHAAAMNQKVAGIIGMTFLDQRVPLVREQTALTPLLGRLGGPLIHALANTPLAGLKIPMWLASKMHTLVNDRAALKACLKDRTSAGNWASLRFLSSYLNYVPVIAPQDFKACPVLLTQPAADRWTPLKLSQPFLERLAQVEVQTRLLENAGHYPLEEPGLTQMNQAILQFIEAVLASTSGTPPTPGAQNHPESLGQRS